MNLQILVSFFRSHTITSGTTNYFNVSVRHKKIVFTAAWGVLAHNSKCLNASKQIGQAMSSAVTVEGFASNLSTTAGGFTDWQTFRQRGQAAQ